MPKVDPFSMAPKKPCSTCTACNLYKKARVVGKQYEGSASASVMIVGEHMSYIDGAKDRLFTGDMGYKLSYLLQRAGLKRKEIALDNVVKCDLNGKKGTNVTQRGSCTPHLLYNILRIKPKVIVGLGDAVCGHLYPDWNNLPAGSSRIKSFRGFPKKRTFSYTNKNGKTFAHTCWIMPTFSLGECLKSWTADDLVIRDLENAKLYAEGETPLTDPDTKITVYDKLEDALDLISTLKIKKKYIIDLETTGLSPHDHKILCIGFCFKEGEAHVLPLLKQYATKFWTETEYTLIRYALQDLFLNSEIGGQGVKFDIKFLRKLTGVARYTIYFDSMAAHHNLDENKPHNLTFQSQHYLYWDKYDTAAHSAKNPVTKQLDMSLLPDEVIWRYLGIDVDGPKRLEKIYIPKLKKQKVMRSYQSEINAINDIADVEFRGVRVDVKSLVERANEVRQKAAVVLESIRQKAATNLGRQKLKSLTSKEQLFSEAERLLKLDGEDVKRSQFKSYFGSMSKVKSYVKAAIGRELSKDFNPNSPKQLRSLLEAIGANLTKKTDTGQISTGKDVLKALTVREDEVGELAQEIMDLRNLSNKLLATYIDGSSLDAKQEGIVFTGEGTGGLLAEVGTHDRTHASYNIHRTVTGRWSANGVALTMPKKGGIRDTIIPDTERDILLSADYSKLELRIMAWLSNDDTMAPELISGVDLHTKMAVAVRLNRYPTEQEFLDMFDLISELERSVAKAVNFGIPYGAVAGTIVHKNPKTFPIDMSFDEREKLVQEIINVYFDAYTGVHDYLLNQIRFAKKHGYLRSLRLGRLRRLDRRWFVSEQGKKTRSYKKAVGHIENEAKNYGIQNFASDQFATAFVKTAKLIRESRIPGFRILMPMHDQFLFNVRERYVEEAEHVIRLGMETVLRSDKRRRYDMPLDVDVKRQRFWGDGEYES